MFDGSVFMPAVKQARSVVTDLIEELPAPPVGSGACLEEGEEAWPPS